MSAEERLARILRDDPLIARTLRVAEGLGLPDWWLVSGAVYNTVWNAQTGRPSGYGIKDIDLFYFDGSDLSYEAEDAVIRTALPSFEPAPPVEIRNQARVHLWFERHFGHPCRPLRSCRDSIAQFAAETHAIGIRTRSGRLEIHAPFGTDPLLDLTLVPNPRRPNRATYEAKAKRTATLWPEVLIEPWPDGPTVRPAHPWTDWADLLSLLQRAFAHMEGRIEPPSSLLRMDAETLAAKAAAEACLVAYDDGRLVGCVFCEARSDRLYIGKLAVAPEAQGLGTGRKLVEAASDLARTLGLDRLELQTRIELVENHNAFARMGFFQTGTTAHPGFDRPTSITMTMPLAAAATEGTPK